MPPQECLSQIWNLLAAARRSAFSLRAVACFLALGIGVAPTGSSAVVIDNDVPIGTVGHLSVDVSSGGQVEDGSETKVTASRQASLDVVTGNVLYEYVGFVDPGADGGATRLSGGAVAVTGDDEVTSSGSFTGANGNTIDWTAVSSIASGISGTLKTTFTFTAQTGTLGTLRFLRYLDEDVESSDDDVLFVRGSAAGSDLELFTVDNVEVYGVSHGGAFSTSQGLFNASFAGWAADQYADLLVAIFGAGLAVSPTGEIDTDDLPPLAHPTVGAAFGPRDLTTILAWDVNPSATTATIITTLGGVPDVTNFFLTLSPGSALNTVGTQHEVTATIVDIADAPQPGFTVSFEVVSGPNAGRVSDSGECSVNTNCSTDANGETSWSYAGASRAGVDEIVASFDFGDSTLQASALKFWDADCNENDIPDTCDLSCEGFGGKCGDSFAGGCGELDLIVCEPLPEVASDWGEALAVHHGSSKRFAYLAIQRGGVEIHDITDVDNPIYLDTYRPDSAECSGREFFADGLYTTAGYLFIASGECSLVVAKIDDETGLLTLEVVVPLDGHAESVYVKYTPGGEIPALINEDPRVFVASRPTGLYVIQVPEEGSPIITLISESDGLLGGPIDVYVGNVDGRELAFVATTLGLFIVERVEGTYEVVGSHLTNPSLDEVPQGLAVRDSRVFLPLWIGGFRVLDIDTNSGEVGDPVQLINPRDIDTPIAFYKTVVNALGTRVYATEGVCGLTVLDVLPGGDFDEVGEIRVDEAGVSEMRSSPFPVAGSTFDCGDDPTAFEPGDPWAWSLAGVDGVLFVTYGIFDEDDVHSGGFQAFEFPDIGIGEGPGFDPIEVPEPSLLQMLVPGVALLGLLERSRRRRN